METCRALPMRGFLYNYRVSSVQVPIGHHQVKKQGQAIFRDGKSVEIRTMLRYDLILISLELDCVTN